ncbi:hypothetical protein FRC17_005475 [Serendipita sp. 399]|nr:hypothetical protein FRC17_005475 [Serendipita sp. 399]
MLPTALWLVLTTGFLITRGVSKHLLELSASQKLDGTCTILAIRLTQLHKDLLGLRAVTERQTQPVESDGEHWDILRIYSYTESGLFARLRQECNNAALLENPGTRPTMLDNGQMVFVIQYTDSGSSLLPPPPPLKVTPLWISGPSENRVDLVFFGDGYTDLEEDKFLQDATRLANDISLNQTFSTVRPLLNIWAAFTPSHSWDWNQSITQKVGDLAHLRYVLLNGLTSVSTTFGLYRVGTELRAIYCKKKPVARAACISLGVGCDYPILLANDNLYGGLGGEFSISTASALNGPLVLRHELGHSIIDVGEEYDGGYAYFGPNSSRPPLKSGVKWAHWVAPSNQLLRVERAVSPLQAYPWTMLNTTTPYAVSFNSSGTYSSYLLKFSLSGLPQTDDLKITIDDQDIGWQPRTGIGMDRWHYDVFQNKSLSSGQHDLTFTLKNGTLSGRAQLCSFEVIEYGDESEFDFEEGNIGAYPTFTMLNETTYRPTNQGCLMRQVVLPNFCKPCTEGLWLQLLKRIELIDDLSVIYDIKSENVFVQVVPVPLGQFRGEAPTGPEFIDIVWTLNGTLVEAHNNQTQFFMPVSEAIGSWKVSLTLSTHEVKVDERGYLTSVRNFVI